MTNTTETFLQGATAYRNARDWAKEQRDKAIRRANEVADDSQDEMLALDASFSGDPSCTTGASRDKTYTIKALSQQSQTLTE